MCVLFTTVEDLRHSLECAPPGQLSGVLGLLLSKEATPSLSRSLPFTFRVTLQYAHEEKYDEKYFMRIKLRVREDQEGNRVLEMSGAT